MMLKPLSDKILACACSLPLHLALLTEQCLSLGFYWDGSQLCLAIVLLLRYCLVERNPKPRAG